MRIRWHPKVWHSIALAPLLSIVTSGSSLTSPASFFWNFLLFYELRYIHETYPATPFKWAVG